MLTNISVAQAAALINAAVVVLNLSFPLLIAAVAIGTLKKTINAATWSVFGHLINQSLWPMVLQTDAAGTVKVDRRIISLSVLATSGAIILAIAAAVTPLGLHTTMRLGEFEDTPFAYVPDTSPFGRSTQSREKYKINRVCGLYTSCPGNTDPYDVARNKTGRGFHAYSLNVTYPNGTVSTDVASNITGVFNSLTGQDRTTVAGAFDVEYRVFSNYNDDEEESWFNQTKFLDYGKPRIHGDFKIMQDFILGADVQLVEGLVVSTTEKPGIGFRNHTTPPTSKHGYAWTEALLWLEPETACTNLNVSFDYIMPSAYESGGLAVDPVQANLSDRGGFASSPRSLELALAGLDFGVLQASGQDDVRLLESSWQAAYLTNTLVKEVLRHSTSPSNRSSVDRGDSIQDYIGYGRYHKIAIKALDPHHPALGPGFGLWDDPGTLSPTPFWNPLLPAPLSNLNGYGPERNTSGSRWGKRHAIGNHLFPGWNQVGNISVAGTTGSLLRGSCSRLDGAITPWSATDSAPPGSKWSCPLFSCVSAVKASVQLVEFEIHGAAALSNLRIKSITPKKYPNDALEPLWASEKLPHASMFDQFASPFWGIVSRDQVDNPGLTTLRRSSVYLPVSGSLFDFGEMGAADSAAGANAPLQALSAVLDKGASGVARELLSRSDERLLSRWAELSKNADSAATIINLLWTDIMANAVVGTKSPLSRNGTRDAADFVLMPARKYEEGLAYDWRFAIPVLIFAALYLGLLIWSIILFIARKLSFRQLVFMLNQTAAGRAMTTERYQAGAEVDFAKTSAWAKTRGGEPVRVMSDDAYRTAEKSSSYVLVQESVESDRPSSRSEAESQSAAA